MKYFWLTIRHKWFVFLAGLKTKAPIWRLIIHDWTKFLPSELPHYQRQFFGKADDPEGFMRAWLHHQNSHKHHWEYYIPRSGHTKCSPPYNANEPIPMPEWAIREMIADWMGASRAYEGKWPTSDWPWLKINGKKALSRMHPCTSNRVIQILGELNFKI